MVALLRFMFQPGNEALAAQKFDGAAICKPFDFLDCVIVVSTSQVLVSIKITVEPNGICTVVCHSQVPSGRCDYRFVVGAVSAKKESLLKARISWVNPRQN